ncbi:hypothetical protein ACUXKH_000835 [Staphylococcus epidermidis]|uniref:hypothetical protein n=1 Tax=Staphylococcus epidermidis TaxID=1282 RepID=UPI001D8A3FE3|nr:hypothetical protein [Staphylococcus epidermidis]MBM6050709.1 hypothetical protein [Staphylococcus epidermidis]MCG2361526.1 hypothetical protein [Staphylococcus epidermidis]MCG2453842.1 hypothetical protein [Staphylococcus epidermidis]MCO6290097.1 hypothetical protein [Staphylococcus epidermidis]
MTYEEIKYNFSLCNNFIDYYSINHLANYYVAYKEENDKTLILKLALNEIITKKDKKPSFELVLMEDEYFVNYNELIDKIVNNNLSLQKISHKKGDMSLGQKIFNSETEAKNEAINEYQGYLNPKNILS